MLSQIDSKNMMRAVLLQEYNSPFLVKDFPIPSIEPDEVLVKVGACGICGSDSFLQKGGFNSVLPIIPGHESAGTVVKCGANVTDIKLGTRAALYYIAHCGKCRFCLAGNENICIEVSRMGVDFPGAMAEYVAIPAKNIIPIPDNLDFASAAVITDAICTPLHALNIAKVKPGDNVMIMGIGGIGSNGVQVAKAMGANVIAASRSEEALQTAKLMGADATIFSNEMLGDKVKALTDGYGVDVVIQCAPGASAYKTALSGLAKRGRLVIVATSSIPVEFDTNGILWAEHEILGSRGFTIADIRQGIQWVLEGRLKVDHLTQTRISIEQINEGMDNLNCKNTIRTVIEF